ncbi:MAG: hypothetical protein NZ902_01660 [Acidilobaceae archaeon]|nr:hypothetical protein [Acidilobaceae archaeon]MCX8165531.1 hypothetical protein [Acidilobaceae archaeon]MDW7973958.1 hypothetical protein [Sulfolobales archaeon]
MSGSTQECSHTGEVVIADTGPVLSGLPLRVSCYVTPQVIEEVKDAESKDLVERALASGKLLVVEPPPAFISMAKEAARRVGVERELSPADISVIALALKLSERCRVKVATDDKRLQLALVRAGFEVMGIRYRKIREARRR